MRVKRELEPYQKAKLGLMRLFKIRPRSRKEVLDYLRRKEYSPDVIQEALSFIDDLGYIDDEMFAKAWAQSRLKKYGPARVRLELFQKGIDRDMINALLFENEDYDQYKVVFEIAERRFQSRLVISLPDAKQRTRVRDYLLRRGFSSHIVYQVLREIQG